MARRTRRQTEGVSCGLPQGLHAVRLRQAHRDGQFHHARHGRLVGRLVPGVARRARLPLRHLATHPGDARGGRLRVAGGAAGRARRDNPRSGPFIRCENACVRETAQSREGRLPPLDTESGDARAAAAHLQRNREERGRGGADGRFRHAVQRHRTMLAAGRVDRLPVHALRPFSGLLAAAGLKPLPLRCGRKEHPPPRVRSGADLLPATDG